MSTVKVDLGERSYEIRVGSGLLGRAGALLAPLLPGKRAVIVSDIAVGERYAARLIRALEEAGIRAEEVWVKTGEASKSFAVYETLVEQLLALQPDRRTAIIALGGGVIGDLAGFTASTLLRGLPFVQVPTTLLAQVDSAVGGKTAINARAGKNLVGSFYQPLAVISDLDTLATLPAREMAAGYAEVVKYGLIADPVFYQWCLQNGAALVKGDKALLEKAVGKSCAMKAAIVGADEKESAGRALLNFGHTFGHALEAEAGYSDTLLHGEAVAIGMVMGCALSQKMGLIDAAVGEQLAAHLKSVGLPAGPRDIDRTWNVERICAHFLSDKKAEDGALTFIVLDAIGKARVAKHVDPALAQAVVEEFVR